MTWAHDPCAHASTPTTHWGDILIDTFIDAMDQTVTLEVNDNADGMYLIINLTSDEHGAVGIALTAEQANDLAETLQILAAGI